MLRLFPSLLLSLLFVLPSVSHAQFWTAMSAVPDSSFNLQQYERHECSGVYAVINGKRLCITLGGRAGAGKVDAKRPIIYDYDANTLTMGENADDQYHHFQAALWRDSIIVVGMSFDNGFPNEIPQSHLHLYYIKSETWVEVDTIPTARARGSAQCVVVEDTAYFFNGLTNGHTSGWVSWTDKYDLVNGVWDTLAPSPRARDHAVALLRDKEVYMVGGRRSAYGNGGLNSFPVYEIDVYNLETNSWTTLPDSSFVPELRAGHMAVMGTNNLGNPEISIWGGEINSDALKTGIALDLQTQIWTSLPDLVEKVHGTSMIAVSEDTLVILAGRDFNAEHQLTDSFYVQRFIAQPQVFPIGWLGASVTSTASGHLQFDWEIEGGEEGLFVIEEKTRERGWQALGSKTTMEGRTRYSWSYLPREAGGKKLFRIHFQTLDGRQNFSPLLTIGMTDQLVRFPNPMTQYSRTIQFQAERVQSAALFNLEGRLIDRVNTPDVWTLPENLPQGMYLLKATDVNGISHSRKVQMR